LQTMTADVLAVPLEPDFMEYVESHFRRELDTSVHEWSRCTRLLAEWENQHLLDNPAQELIARHKQAIERLLRFGKFLLLVTEQSGISEQQARDIVRATQSGLQDRLSLWHGQTLADRDRSEILKACFNES
jgi:hypothetical protein